MTRYMVVLSYKGTSFHGFQRQPDARTVQGSLEEALATLTGEKVATAGAGRTDAGVHAAAQVAAFDLPRRVDEGRWRTSLNALTPGDMAIVKMAEVQTDFDPRRDALWREYKYFLLNRTAPSPPLADVCLHYSREMDLTKARSACDSIKGTHDFSAFTLSSEKGNTVRDVIACDIGEVELLDGMLCVTVRAGTFLYRMVRILVGAILKVSSGAMDMSDLELSLSGGTRPCSEPLSPEGLFFWRVEYPREKLSA